MSAHRLTDEELTRAAMEVHPSSLEHNEAHATDAEVRTHIHLLDSWIQAANLLAAWRRGEIELDVRPGLNGWVMSGLGPDSCHLSADSAVVGRSALIFRGSGSAGYALTAAI